MPLAGRMGNNPNGTQEGTTTITLTPEGRADPLLAPLGQESFPAAGQSHPIGAVLCRRARCAWPSTLWDANQAFRIGERAWGLQFHPEMDAEIARSSTSRLKPKPCARRPAGGADPARRARNPRWRRRYCGSLAARLRGEKRETKADVKRHPLSFV